MTRELGEERQIRTDRSGLFRRLERRIAVPHDRDVASCLGSKPAALKGVDVPAVRNDRVRTTYCLPVQAVDLTTGLAHEPAVSIGREIPVVGSDGVGETRPPP